MKIIFVCTGNTCRSPMAEGFLKKLLQDSGNADTKVISRGIAAVAGEGASYGAIMAAKELGVDISDHISQNLTLEDIENANLLLTMTQAHAAFVKSAFPDYAHKVFSIGEYTGGADVSDPYGGDMVVYRECAEELMDAAKKINLIISEKQ